MKILVKKKKSTERPGFNVTTVDLHATERLRVATPCIFVRGPRSSGSIHRDSVGPKPTGIHSAVISPALVPSIPT